jgi:hypothetical protein
MFPLSRSPARLYRPNQKTHPENETIPAWFPGRGLKISVTSKGDKPN